MKNIYLIIGTLFLLMSCSKENGKNSYDLTFNYDSGESENYVCVIYEKRKSYETGYGDLEDLKQNKNGIVLQSVKDESPYIKLKLLKTEAEYLACYATMDFWFQVNGKQINGPLEMYGKYEKKGKAFTVNEGTFSVYWENAADYGEQPQLLTGTWTLRRQ